MMHEITIRFDADNGERANETLQLMLEAFCNDPSILFNFATLRDDSDIPTVIRELPSRDWMLNKFAIPFPRINMIFRPDTCEHCKRVIAGTQSCCPFHY